MKTDKKIIISMHDFARIIDELFHENIYFIKALRLKFENINNRLMWLYFEKL